MILFSTFIALQSCKVLTNYTELISYATSTDFILLK